jgi:hypothetical protein
MHQYLESWLKPGREPTRFQSFDFLCMDCKILDGSISPDTDGSREVMGDKKRLARQEEIQAEDNQSGSSTWDKITYDNSSTDEDIGRRSWERSVTI